MKAEKARERYSPTLSLTSVLNVVGWSRLRPGLFTSGNEIRYSLNKRLGGSQGRSGRVRKISPAPGFDPLTIYSQTMYQGLNRLLHPHTGTEALYRPYGP